MERIKKYWKEIIIVLLEGLLFFVVPLLTKGLDSNTLILIAVSTTAILSLALGIFSKELIKFYFPLVCGLFFIICVFMYYKQISVIYSLWYISISCVGLIIGSFIRSLRKV